MSDPRLPHWTAAIHVLRYLKTDVDRGYSSITVQIIRSKLIVTADWAACPHTRRFFSGYVVFLGDYLIS